ncbi:alpha/beta hydrolase [Paenibacillus lutrae]|uniref:Esterase family protein n=1 Tax=Paenibacillus lutrae TaxID=2078573 RepID=A0A7X3JYX9_9BACL|nr:alpha/beta hydrolase-fold protein [Paenibacillus lutrae]MVO99603.1 esterase family protein [Paenibacillus lutrae]
MTDARLYKRTIVKEEIASIHLNSTRPIRVFLPPGYNEVLSYPVIYCQDGEEFFNFGRIATSMTAGILDHGWEPVIIVGVDVNVKIRTSEYSPDGENHAAYIRFFAEEMLPYIESRYAVRADKAERVLAGDSLGGTVSLHLALAYPHLFTKVISLSGAFLEPTREELAAHSDLSWLELYMLIGLDEEEVKTERGVYNFVEANRLTKTILEQKNTRLYYEEKPGKHIWGFWQKELPNTLEYFFG